MDEDNKKLVLLSKMKEAKDLDLIIEKLKNEYEMLNEQSAEKI